MRKSLRKTRGHLVLAAALICAATPSPSTAGIFDFFFKDEKPARSSAAPQAQPQQDIFDPFGLSTPSPAPAPVSSGGGRYASYCVRTCDGKYFPLVNRAGVSPAQVCQSFCPAATTKVFSGGVIDSAVTMTGERYADMPNAFAYRKALKADCTCNGRDPAGLAPVDLSLDTTLRPGDIVATSNGLVAYTGVSSTDGQTAQFTPVTNYPGLTSDIRAKLGEMKVSPVAAADVAGDDPEATGSISSNAAFTKRVEALPLRPTRFSPGPR